MMTKFKIIFISFLLISNWACAQNLEAKFQAVIDSIYQVHPESVGIMAHVESPDHGISWSGAIGVSEKDTKNILEADQPALIASNIKTYISATILCLVEDGELTIDQGIMTLLSDKTRKLFSGHGYDLNAITIKHLLSHTSGVENYANQAYIDFINANKQHRWTRDEQLELTITTGPPLGPAGSTFTYSDANYLLLTEIIEGIEAKPFYMAMRDLLKYDQLEFDNTWFPTLEEKPEATKELAHQYWGMYKWDSHDIDISFDLYGGGGIACTTEDLSSFVYQLFNGGIIENKDVLNLIYTEVQTNDSTPSNYYLGLSKKELDEHVAHGHGGFWGTVVFYVPEVNASIAVYILERDQRKKQTEILNLFVKILKS